MRIFFHPVSGVTHASLLMCIQFLINAVVVPVLSVDSTTATSISLSWTSAGSVVDYEVMWQRDTSGECSDEDEGNTTITDGSTSYDIMGLEEDSNYTVSVMAINSIGNANSDTVTGMTVEAGTKKVHKARYNM